MRACIIIVLHVRLHHVYPYAAKMSKIIFIIIIISLGQILLSYIGNTSRTHARTHANTHARARARARTLTPTRTRTRARRHARTRTHAHTYRRCRSGCRCVMGRWHPTVSELRPFSPVLLATNGRSLLRLNTHWRGRPGFSEVLVFFASKRNCYAELRRHLVT